MKDFNFKKVFIFIGISLLLFGTTTLCWGAPTLYYFSYEGQLSSSFTNPRTFQLNPTLRIDNMQPIIYWGQPLAGGNVTEYARFLKYGYENDAVEAWPRANGSITFDAGWFQAGPNSPYPMIAQTGIDSVDFNLMIGLGVSTYGDPLGATWSLLRFPPFTIGISDQSNMTTLTFPGALPAEYFSLGGVAYLGTLFLTPFAQGGLNLEVDPVPEPATILLLGSGLIGLWGLRRKFKK